jgi:hypothetical protein
VKSLTANLSLEQLIALVKNLDDFYLGGIHGSALSSDIRSSSLITGDGIWVRVREVLLRRVSDHWKSRRSVLSACAIAG